MNGVCLSKVLVSTGGTSAPRHPNVNDVIVAGERLCERESAGKPAAPGLHSHFDAGALAQRNRLIRDRRGVRDLLAMYLVPGLVHLQHDLTRLDAGERDCTE